LLQVPVFHYNDTPLEKHVMLWIFQVFALYMVNHDNVVKFGLQRLSRLNLPLKLEPTSIAYAF